MEMLARHRRWCLPPLPFKCRGGLMQVVHCLVTKLDKDGRPYKALQAFEIVNGVRRPTSTPTKEPIKGVIAKEKFK